MINFIRFSVARAWRGGWQVLSRTNSTTASIVTSKASAVKDQILYKYDNDKFYRILNAFGIGQLAFWGTMVFNTYNFEERPVPEQEEVGEDVKPWYLKLNLASESTKTKLCVFYVFVGYAIVGLTSLYTLRSVRYIVLKKDGRTLTIITYSPFGRNRGFDIPTAYVSAAGSRTSGTTMPIQVKGHRLFYLLDTRGTIPRKELFDKTVGIKQQWTKK